MILAAIDIGSNAIRLQVIRIIREEDLVSFKKLEYFRFPLRLGKDAFSKGVLEDATLEKFEKLMRTFKLVIELYEVDGYIATATSAMRELDNGEEIVQKIATFFDLKIRIISGVEEAEILSKAIIPYLDEKNYVHIDVGGGSTELNVYKNKERIASFSQKIGSVREMDEKEQKLAFKDIRKWAKKEISDLKQPITAVGTGGNINKLFKLSNHPRERTVSLTELQALRAYVNEFDYEKRMQILKMNPDRADVIVPAADIYIKVMNIIGADRILVPGVGLKDGLLYTLFEKQTGESIKKVQFLGLW